MVVFVLGSIAMLVALIWFVATRKAPPHELSTAAKTGPTTALSIIGVLLIILSTVTMVSTKNIGVTTEFGRPTGNLSNGLHFTLPWVKVTELDGALQTDTYTGDSAVKVRIGNMSTASVDATVQWRINPESADILFQDYREFDNIREGVVDRQLKAVLNEVLSDYDPLSIDANGQVGIVNYDNIAEEAQQLLQERVGSHVIIANVTVPLVQFDPSTQNRINAYQEEIGNTRVATQRQRTAEAQAEANRILADSVSNDPNVLVAQCLDTLQDMVDSNQTVPAGFTCWPGSGSTLVVPSTAPANNP